MQALEALQLLARTEGLISALEPSHAVYHAMQVCTVYFPSYSSHVLPLCVVPVGLMVRVYCCSVFVLCVRLV